MGPESDKGHCYPDGCGYKPHTGTDDELEIDDLEIDEEVEERELADRGETRPGLFRRLTNGALDLASSAAKTVYDTVYKLSSEALDDIANIMRTVLNETVYGMFAETGEGILDTVYDPGIIFRV